MKRMNYLTAVLLFMTCGFVACNHTDEPVYDEASSKVVLENDERIERNVLTLSSGDAMKVAQLFSKGEDKNNSRATSIRTLKNIQTVSSETGEPLMFVVNYADNQGYVVVGATKNYAPVLAYSEQGNISAEDDFFAQNTFFNEYKAKISTVVNEEIDSLRQRYALSWAAYEKAPEVVESRAYSDAEIEQKKAEARTYYGNLGYEVLPMANAAYMIPAGNGMTAEQRGNAFIADICNHTAPEYDCMDVNLFLFKRTYYNYRYLTTNWHQGIPYNVGTPNGFAGCVPIAVTQLMKFFEWPESIDWSNIRTNWTGTATADEAFFIRSVRELMNPTYATYGTEVTYNDMIAALTHLEYEVVVSNYSRELAKEYILAGIPFIMGGHDIYTGIGHAWVCDGYQYHKAQYAAYMINRDEDEYQFFEGMTDIYVDEYFHMNFGEDINYNTWYFHDNVAVGNMDYSSYRLIYKVTPAR